MTNEHMEQVLLEALDLLEAGYSMDTVLQRFPAEADELRPYLLTVQQLAELAPSPPMAAQQASRQSFLAAASQPVSRREPERRRTVNRWGWLLRPVLVLLALAFLGSGAVVAASGQTIPGDALYGVKRLVEESRLALSPDPDAVRAALREERLREVRALLALDRQGTVTFTGTIEVIGPEQWLVAGVPVIVSPETVIEGDALTGRAVEVMGQTGSGAVVAERIVVISGSSDGPEQVPVSTATPEPTPTLAATSTPQATPEPTATSAGVGDTADDANVNDGDNDNTDDDDDDGSGDDDNANSGDDTNANDDDDDNANDGDDDNINDGDDDNVSDSDDDNANGGDDDNANDGDDDNANGGDDDNANDDDNENSDDDANDNGADGDDSGDSSGSDDDDDDGNANEDDSGDSSGSGDDDNANDDDDDDNANDDDDDDNANDNDGDGNANGDDSGDSSGSDDNEDDDDDNSGDGGDDDDDNANDDDGGVQETDD